jgi:hypothetical protein
MALINLVTNLKSLRYGNDRFDGGNSGQPYIQKPIPNRVSTLGAFNNDFILRGGTLTLTRSLNDVERLGRMFSDLRSPKGLFFIAKQAALSNTAPRTQASGKLNGDAYNPLNTLAQAGIVAFGGHLNKQGLGSVGPLALKTYSETVTYKQTPNENRLATLYTVNKEKTLPKSINGITYNNTVSVMSYKGGPGANLGIGNTYIKYAGDEQRTGEQNIYFNTNENWFYGKNLKTTITADKYLNSINTNQIGPLLENKGVSGKYFKLTGVKVKNEDLWTTNAQNSVYKQGNTFPKVNNNVIYANGSFTYNQEEIIDPYFSTFSPFLSNNSSEFNSKASPKIQDFRAKLRNNTTSTDTQKQTAIENGSITKAPGYDGPKAYESRVNIGGKDRTGPGYFGTKNLSSYSGGGSGVGPIDQINALTSLDTISANDLVKFRITFIDNSEPTTQTYLHFRAFLDSMSDSYNATWNNFNFLGRNEQFYTYGGYSRQMSLSWTVAAQSKEELIPMYKKLNYLASSLTGDYSGQGYMRGNLVKLTVGGYVYEQPGIITSLTYDVPTESPWEIGIDDNGNNDPTVKELPHIMKVTGFNFIPIQTFIPQMQKELNDTRRYISLSNGPNNYTENFKDYTPKNFAGFNGTNS